MADEGTPPAGADDQHDDGGDAAAPVQSEAGGDTPGDEIRDPAAYYKAQAEKLDRLLKREAETRASLEKRLETIGQQTSEDVMSEFETLKAELEAERTAAQQARLEAERTRAVTAAGLPPALAKFVTGEDAEAIAAQVEELSQLLPKTPPAAEKSRTANPSGGSDLTMERIQQIKSPQEYMAQRDKVLAFLKADNK
jgi:DNA repair exonuclease SbcCD ATPase subunit